MEEIHRIVLRQQRNFLTENISDFSWILEELYSNSIISAEDKERIKKQTTSFDSKRELLDLLPKCGQRAFGEFIKALQAHSEDHVAQCLLDTESSLPGYLHTTDPSFLFELSPKTKERLVTPKELLAASRKLLPSFTEAVAIEMKISKAQLEQIRESCYNNSQRVINEVFYVWRTGHGNSATVEAFIRALHDAGVDRDVYENCLENAERARTQQFV